MTASEKVLAFAMAVALCAGLVVDYYQKLEIETLFTNTQFLDDRLFLLEQETQQ